MTDPTQQHLTATYSSPTNARFIHTTYLPTPATLLPKDRVPYLTFLKAAVVDLQEKINTDLTARMEEDKLREASTNEGAGSKSKVKGVDEAKEEDNYGEEVVDED